MKKLNLIVVGLMIVALPVLACDATKHLIDKLVLKGDVTITFKPDGTASTITCNTKKYSIKQCEHVGMHIFEYYHKHKRKLP